MDKRHQLLIALCALFLSACSSGGGGIGLRTLQTNEAGVMRCLGLEGHEIATIAAHAIVDIEKNFLAKNPALQRQNRPVRVVIDGAHWLNKAEQAVNMNIIADQLSVGLQRSAGAGSKLAFLSREHLDAVQAERDLKRQGRVDKGALGLVDKIAGADYRMVGQLSDHKTTSTQGATRATTLILSLLDLESGAKVWSWQFSIVKEAELDVFC